MKPGSWQRVGEGAWVMVGAQWAGMLLWEEHRKRWVVLRQGEDNPVAVLPADTTVRQAKNVARVVLLTGGQT